MKKSSNLSSSEKKKYRLFVFSKPPYYPLLAERVSGISFAIDSALNTLNRAMEVKVCPKTMERMIELAKRHLNYNGNDHLVVVECTKELSKIDFSVYGEIILLWPDALGLNWEPIERKILARELNPSGPTVLNGRGRCFLYTKKMRRMIRLRRFLEKYWVGESLFSLAFIVVSPTLVIVDLLRKRT